MLLFCSWHISIHTHDAFLIMGSCSHMCKFQKLKRSMMGYTLKEFEWSNFRLTPKQVEKIFVYDGIDFERINLPVNTQASEHTNILSRPLCLRTHHSYACVLHFFVQILWKPFFLLRLPSWIYQVSGRGWEGKEGKRGRRREDRERGTRSDKLSNFENW